MVGFYLDGGFIKRGKGGGARSIWHFLSSFSFIPSFQGCIYLVRLASTFLCYGWVGPYIFPLACFCTIGFRPLYKFLPAREPLPVEWMEIVLELCIFRRP